MRLRWHLVVLVAVSAGPLLAFAILVLVRGHAIERRALEQELQETSRALAIALDGEMDSSIAVLGALAESSRLDVQDFRGFYEEARRVRDSHGRWRSVFLADASGQELLTLLKPFGTPLPFTGDREHVRRTVEGGKPFVSDLMVGVVSGDPVIVVDVPVYRRGALRYVLSASFMPVVLERVVGSKAPFGGSRVTVIDRKGVVVARTRDDGRWVGRPMRPDFLEQARTDDDGAFESVTLDGEPVFATVARAPRTGFLVSVAMPLSEVRAPLWRSLRLLAGGGFVLVVVALGTAVILGHQVTNPILSLAALASAVGRGEQPRDAGVAPVSEVEQVRHRLLEMSALIRDRASERERLLVEQAARQEAERTTMLLREREDRVKEGEARLQAIIDNVSALVFVKDLEGRYVLANRHFENAFGIKPASLVGKTDEELFAPAEAASFRADDLAVLQTGEAMRFEESGQRPDGRHTYLSLKFPLRQADGSICAVGAVATDITDHARAEQALRQAGRAKDEFLAMLGHELRNPLSAITMALAILDRTTSVEPSARARGVIRRQVRHLVEIVEDLLDLARVTTGKIVLNLRPMDLGAAVSRYLDGLDLKGRTGRFDRRIEAVWVQADETRIEQIASNLVVNALKYTPGDRAIRVVVRAEPDAAVLVVEDEGIGISPSTLSRVFEPFFQADTSLERGQGGLGVGLTLVRRLVELRGGTISVASPGREKGSTFTVRLPASEPAGRQALDTRPIATPTARRRVLVIEDNPDGREMMAQMLELLGHEVHVAEDGPTGLQRAIEIQPDVALVDVGLPGLDGYEVAQRLRQRPEVKAMRLVAVTGYGREEDQRRSAAAGFDAHLVKPVDDVRLAEALGPQE